MSGTRCQGASAGGDLGAAQPARAPRDAAETHAPVRRGGRQGSRVAGARSPWNFSVRAGGGRRAEERGAGTRGEGEAGATPGVGGRGRSSAESEGAARTVARAGVEPGRVRGAGRVAVRGRRGGPKRGGSTVRRWRPRAGGRPGVRCGGPRGWGRRVALKGSAKRRGPRGQGVQGCLGGQSG